MSDHSSISISRRTRIARVATVLALCATLGSGFSQEAEKKAHSVSEKTQEAFGKLKPLQDAQNYTGMLELLNSIKVEPNSYDEALILDMKAKIYGMTNQLAKAIAPWERAVQLSDKFNYFPEKTVLDIVYFLGQLYAQEATTTKDSKLAQEQYTKALAYFKRFLDKTPNPTPEAVSTYAMLLYYKAIADPNNVDKQMLQEARTVVERGLTTAIKPKESFYQLLLALQQQQNDLTGSAEILELLLAQNPKKKDQWQMLMAIYLQLNEKFRETDPDLAREYLVRSIVTVERAQALGFQDTPKDNMNLVSLYLLANQFTKGTELLYNGMKKGTIESEPHNWRVLGRYYQEANMNKQAIAVLKEATELFPKNSELEVQIAQIYLQMENTAAAFEHARKAIAKNNFEGTKPYSVHYLIAYTAYELERIEDAHAAILEAEKFPEHKDDPQFARLKDVVMELVAEREAKEKPKDDPEAKKDEVKKTADVR